MQECVRRYVCECMPMCMCEWLQVTQVCVLATIYMPCTFAPLAFLAHPSSTPNFLRLVCLCLASLPFLLRFLLQGTLYTADPSREP